MQDNVEQQLLTCQEMFLEIEQKVASLSSLSQVAGLQQQDELEAVGSQQEVTELLFSKLQFLKVNLISFQQLLQNRQEEERTTDRRESLEQKSVPQPERPLESKLKRSCSVQELFSSPRNKLLRQSSLQQQKELEQMLTEQRGLTHALARQGSRARLHSQEPDGHSQLSPCPAPAEADAEEDSAQKKWDHLHSRLLAVEESWLLPPSEVTDSSVRRTDGTAGCMIGTQSLKELQTHINHVRELGHEAAELLSQVSSVEGSRQTLDEGLFHVLCGASLFLSSINNLLHSPAGTMHGEDAHLWSLQLQQLSAELAALGSELLTLGSKVSDVLGSDSAQRCVADLSRILPGLQTALKSREKQLQNLQEEIEQHQRNLRELHAAFTSNRPTVHHIINELSGTLGLNEQLQAAVQMQGCLQQQAEQVKALLDEADRHHLSASVLYQTTQIQEDLDAALGGVRSRCEELRSSVESQHQYERLVHSYEELLTLGSERLTQQPDTELRSRAQLQQQLSRHTKFFQFLGHHYRILQYLTWRLPESTLQRWEGVVMGLQDKVAQLQQHGLEKGTRMQETLQMWSQWEEDSAWSDSLLRGIKTSFPKMHEGGDSEEHVSDKLSVYQELGGVLKANEARFSRMLQRGHRLMKLGCRAVVVPTNELEARWRSLQRRVEQGHTNISRKRDLSSRFLRDSAVLADWMAMARELTDQWSRLSVAASEETDAEQWRGQYLQCVAFTKDLEAKTELKVSVIGAGTQLVQMWEADGHSDGSLEDQAAPLSQSSDLNLCSVNTQLRQVELDWSSLLDDVPVVQQTLHKRWVETLTQQGALLELQAWLGAAESLLEEHRSRINQTSSTSADLTQFLKYCKECQVETSAHQATLDYVNQSLWACSTEDDHRERYKHNQFAEDQGCLNHQWLRLQETLNSQVREVELDLRSRAQLEARLLQTNTWITEQNSWINSAQTPSSQMELQRSISTCQDLEEKIRQRSAALRELRDKLCDTQGNSSCDLIAQTDESIQACTALAQLKESVKLRLIRAQQLWDSVEKNLNEMMLKTLRTSQTLNQCSPQLSLQAQIAIHQRLQLLHEETEASKAEWDELSQAMSSLREVISPAAATLLTKQLNQQRDSWTVVCGALDQQLQRSRGILQVWEVYTPLAASLSQQQQLLQSDISSALSAAPEDDSTKEQVAIKIHSVQSLLERTGNLHSNLQEVLDASRDLTDHLEPLAAGLVQSESRLFSRDISQFSQMLSGKLGQLQEELQQLQDFETSLESLERNLELWHQRVQNVQAADQAGLLELSGLSADLDVLNELSRSLTLDNAAACRLQRLNRRWADTSTRAEEARSQLQTETLKQQNFGQKCESWMSFLQRMEDSLAVDVAGSYVGLRQQLCTHKRFQAELPIAHQILHSVITEALHLLQKGEVGDRTDFILKLAQLRENWQLAVQRADQRCCLVQGLMKHWHLYSHSLRKLQKARPPPATTPPAAPAGEKDGSRARISEKLESANMRIV
uniref:nesprin-2-like n=1 Tax=Monopterus albus TaxID=43700 RepID=UPI0009B40D3F|nr:nesprin-2-like [Monopterus albus]